MKIRLTFLASIAMALTLALVGVLKDVSPTGANMPRPVQPFAALSRGGISTTQLGQGIGSNFTVTQVLRGERVTLPWIYSGAGFSVDQTEPLLTDVGSVWSAVDVGCNGSTDFMQLKDSCASPAEDFPLRWIKQTTAVTGTDEEYLLKIMPPFTWLLRHRAIIQEVCVGGGGVASPSVLNTVYATIPFSPTDFGGKQAYVAQTQLGGAPDTPPSKVCLDSPQNSESITTVYNNPLPYAVGDGDLDNDGLNDYSGLYPRWTIFQSKGSSSLNAVTDLRKSYQSPPSLPNDMGYVERTIQLECFWIDGNGCDATHGDCDADDSDYISPEESWNDPDLVALGGKTDVDADGDCLMNSAHAQLGWPAVDAVDDPTSATSCDANPNWIIYSEDPILVHHNTANDQDCDGLVDGVEWFWGGNARVTSADGDTDGAPDFVEMFQFTNPTVADTDGDTYADKPSSAYGTNTDVSMDNCPTVSNNPQINTDGGRRPNGALIPNGGVGDSASNPAQDKQGDACDVDNDNDLAVDGYETSTAGGKLATLPLVFDTDGDTVGDGSEYHAGFVGGGDPNDKAVKPTWDGTNDQIYYRGCQINVNTAYAGYTEQDGTADGVEMDVDGDGGLCPTDGDSDTYMPGKKAEVLDKYEAFGYGTLIANQDTDGDGCADWVEIHDLNGDRTANSTDIGLMNKRFAGKIANTDPVSEKIFDVNKDGSFTSADTGQMNKNNCLFKSGTGGCGAVCSAVPLG